jgi:hypothetical protein
MHGASAQYAPRKSIMPERFLAILKSPAEGVVALFAAAFMTITGGAISGGVGGDGGTNRYVISGLVSVAGIFIIYGIKYLVEVKKASVQVHHDNTEAGTKSQAMLAAERKDLLAAQKDAIKELTASFKEVIAEQRASFIALNEVQRRDFEQQIVAIRQEKHDQNDRAQRIAARYLILSDRVRRLPGCNPDELFAAPLDTEL